MLKKQMLVAALAAWAAGCGGEHKEARKGAEAPVVRAQLAQVAEEEIASEYVAPGTVRARTSSVVSARVMGYLREVRVQAGDTVKAGQILAVIEAKEIDSAARQAEAARAEARQAKPELDAALQAAQAQLGLAQATHQRMANLFAQKSVTNQELDEAAARLKLAQANVEMTRAKQAQLTEKLRQADEGVAQAQVMKGYATLAAPFAGLVVERKAEPGMLASPGLPLFTIEQAGGYRLEASVDEQQLGLLKVGQAVKAELETGTVAGRIEEIVPSLDATSHSFVVKVGLSAAGLRSGQFGKLRAGAGTRKALVLPATAIVEQGQVQRVYVVEGGVARGRLVSTGGRVDGRVEVLSGLAAKDTVVAPVPPALVDGARVEGSAR